MNCQKKLKMHPSMYDDSDVPNHRSVEGLRCSKRLPSLIKAQLCPCCNSCSSPCKMLNPCELEVDHGSLTHKLEIPHKGNLENDPNDQACSSIEILDRDTIDGMFGDKSIEKQVSEGPLFQAEVPEWTGVASESDSKWLGMPTWAPKVVKGSCMIQMDPIGKGRQDLCGCRCPGSVDCVRFHIAEKRMKLKLELDLAFYHWRFDCMGEEVSLSWTVEEENRFKTMVQSNAPFPNKSFWDVSSKFFPTKTKEKLVSYYFNVFLIRRRSYQNRVIPKNIDSDDDEMEFGCVGDGFGYEAVRIPGSKLLLCTQNEQCTELE